MTPTLISPGLLNFFTGGPWNAGKGCASRMKRRELSGFKSRLRGVASYNVSRTPSPLVGEGWGEGRLTATGGLIALGLGATGRGGRDPCLHTPTHGARRR